MAPVPRPGILDVAPYVGGESHVSGVNRVIRLASNENPLGCSPEARAAYAGLGEDLHRYPDGGALALREAIGRAHGVDPAGVVCGAGSDELIALLVRAYAGPGDRVVHSAHGFLMYSIAARTAGAEAVAVPESDLCADVDGLLAATGEETRLLFLANPNNPTGSYLSAEALQRLHSGLPEHVLLVIDAAYAEYVEAGDYADGARMVEAADNVVMTRTFSKIHGLAALRLGWAYCPPAVADVLNRVRGPFNVSAAAQAAGVAALDDRSFIDRSRAHNTQWRAWLAERLADLPVTVYPSEGNFLLVAFPEEAERDADAAVARLKSRGILLRAMGAYGLPHCLRITVGTEEETKAVESALREFFQ